MLIAILACLAFGVLLTTLGLRGERVEDHPLCRKCGFDLTGRTEGSTRCPECGTGLDRPGAVVVGRRRRRGVPLGVGLAVLLPALLVAGVLGWHRAERVHWLRYATVDYLLQRATSADATRRSPALAELSARFADGRLTGAAWDRTADAGLAYQGDAAKPWDVGWGDLIESAHAAGRVSDGRWRRYAAQAVGRFSLQVRPTVCRGASIPCALRAVAGRAGEKSAYTMAALCLELRDLRVGAAGRTVFQRGSGSASPLQEREVHLDLRGSVTYEPRVELGPAWAALQDGPQLLRAKGTVVVGSREENYVVRPAATATFDVTAPFAVVPAGTVTVQLVRDPSLADAVRRSIRVRPPVHEAGNSYGTGMLYVKGPPVGLSFAISVRTGDGREYPAGHVACRAATNGGYGLGGWPMSLIGTPVDVILRPDPSVAAGTVDATQAWDEPIVITGVR